MARDSFPLTLDGVRPLAEDATHSRASFGAALPFHRVEDNSTEPASAATRTREEEEEEEEEGEGEQGEGAPDSRPCETVTGVGSRRTSSSTWTRDPGDTFPHMSDAIPDALLPPDWDDESYVQSSRTSFATTIASAVSRLCDENGRLYPNYGENEYGLPVDMQERERLSLQHEMYSLVLDGNTFLAPIDDRPQKILDLATGTGEWAVDVADRYPAAVVLGIDVAQIQPRWVPPNCEFEVGDVEDAWRFRTNSFDFIHMRDPLFVVRDWETLIGQCFQHLKPNGWCELAGTYLAPASDDDSMPEDSAFRLMCGKLIEASKAFGTPADCPLHFADSLQRAGFVNVRQHTFKIPSCPWPDDERQMRIGYLEQDNLDAGASAFGLRLFQRAFGWTSAQTEVEMVPFRKDLANPDYRQYLPQ